MDALSLLASIAGVSTTGVALSKAIYDLISSIQGTPKEISDIARGISDLSLILSELRRVLRDGRKLYRRKLLRRIDSAVRRIRKIHKTIDDLINIEGMEGLARLKWLFRRSKTMHLLYQIESHKTGVNMVLQIMILALQSRKISDRDADSERQNPSSSDDPNREDKELLRQQAENLVQMSYQSLRDMVGAPTRDGPTPDESEEDDSQDPNNATNQQVVLWKPEVDETSRWLYDLVFSPFNESSGMSASKLSTVPTEPTTSGMDREGGETAMPSVALNTSDLGISTALVAHQRGQMQMLLEKPVPSTSVVNELLAEWTTLTEDEIEEVTIEETQATKAPPAAQGRKQKERVIRFKDAVGRKFTFPFHRVNTWQGMEDFIKQALLHVDVLGPHVQQGHYDLEGPNGDIYLPAAWENLIEPGDVITMHMWPLDKAPLRGAGYRPMGPGQIPRPGLGVLGVPAGGPRPGSGWIPLPLSTRPGHPPIIVDAAKTNSRILSDSEAKNKSDTKKGSR